MTNLRARLLASSLLAGAALVAAPVSAQVVPQAGAAELPDPNSTTDSSGATPGAETSTQEIVVTGSLIRNPNLVSSSPVNVVSEQEIIRRAPGTAEEILRALPGVVPGIGTQVNNGANGTNTVDLRGLGIQRNIVLLDGNRVVPSLANGAVDLNIVPIALIQRVDVLTGGASTTYGADAVSGVVNFITRSDFTGVDVRSTYKITEQGDGATFRADLTLGSNFADDRGNAVINLSYTEIDPVYQTRDFSIFGVSSVNGRASGESFTSVPTTISFDTADLQLSPTGATLVPQYQGFNFNPYNIFQTPIDRKSAYAAATYDISDTVHVYAKGLFSQTSIQQIIAPSGLFGVPLTIPSNNPYLNTAIRNQICTNQGIAVASPDCTANPALPLPAVYRRLVELGPRISDFENNLYDARGGVRFDVTPSSTLDLSASFGRSEQRQTQSGYVLNSRVQQALNATNTTTCTVTANNCVPLNLFGAVGSITPDQVAFLAGESTTRINTELSQVRALYSGDFGLTVPGASNPIGFAVGGEYREYKYERLPDLFAQNPVELGGAGGAVLPFSGGYEVTEGFAELIAPIFNDKPFFDELTLEAGVRYSDYKIKATGASGFDTWTYKGGGTWQPVEGVRIRGNYQRAVRAPNIAELFTPVVTGLTNLAVDPCAGAAPTTNAALRAVCIAQGAPVASIGSIQNPSAGQANATGGGNIALRPEKADTYTIGVVLTPRDFVPGLSVSVDYYNIKIDDAITSPTPGDAIAACFSNLSATSAACTGIRRNPANGRLSGPSSTTAGLPLTQSNQGKFKTDGIDLTINYQSPAIYGDVRVNLNFIGNWTNQLKFQATPVSVNRDCVGYYSANCGPSLGQIQPEFSWQQRSTIQLGGADVSLLWRHIDSVKYEGQAANFAARGFTAANRNLFAGAITGSGPLVGRTVNFNRIKKFDYFDLTTQFDVSDGFQLTVGVTNLFDKKPPVVGGQAGTTTANSGNTFPSTYDPLGRTFAVTGRMRF